MVLVCRMLGHNPSTVTLNVYAHLFADDLDTVVDRLHDAKIESDADQRHGRSCFDKAPPEVDTP